VTGHLHNETNRLRRGIPETAQELQAIKKEIITEEFGGIEKAFLIQALKACEGNVTRSAERVGMQRSNFHSLMKRHQLSAVDYKPSS
jgi:transcriptional regulator of acetoin/glycerol metabolism